MNINIKNPELHERCRAIAADHSLELANLQSLVAVNSGSYHLASIQRVQDLLIEQFSVLPAKCVKIPVEPREEFNEIGEKITRPLGAILSWQARPEAPYQVLLVGHCDTVFGENHPFQNGQLKGDKLFGPGAADMKGGLLVAKQALVALEQLSYKNHLGWRLLITSDEEIGSVCSRPHLEQAAQQAQIGLVFEPALDRQGTFVGARKGSGSFVAHIYGKSAHVGRAFAEGIHAIHGAAFLTEKLHALNQSIPGIILNVGVISGGQVINQVPDFAQLRINIRVESTPQQEEVQQCIQNILMQTSEQTGCQINWYGEFNRPPKPLDTKTRHLFKKLQRCCEQCDLTFAIKDTGGVSDGNVLAATGLPTIDTLGVCGEGIHTEKEYMLIKSLTSRAQLTFLLLATLAKETHHVE